MARESFAAQLQEWKKAQQEPEFGARLTQQEVNDRQERVRRALFRHKDRVGREAQAAKKMYFVLGLGKRVGQMRDLWQGGTRSICDACSFEALQQLDGQPASNFSNPGIVADYHGRYGEVLSISWPELQRKRQEEARYNLVVDGRAMEICLEGQEEEGSTVLTLKAGYAQSPDYSREDSVSLGSFSLPRGREYNNVVFKTDRLKALLLAKQRLMKQEVLEVDNGYYRDVRLVFPFGQFRQKQIEEITDRFQFRSDDIHIPDEGIRDIFPELFPLPR